MFSWGRHSNGQLGQGGIEEEHVVEPRFMRHMKCPPSEILTVASASDHTLVCVKSGTVYSFGSNEYGKLAQPFGKSRPERVHILAQETIKQVACGDGHSMALNTMGKVITWGDNRTAQLSHDFHDDPDNRFSDRWITYTFQDTDEDAPVKEDMPMLPRQISHFNLEHIVCSVACGAQHSMLLTVDCDVLVWGSNARGQCACPQGVKECRQPRQVPLIDGAPIVTIATGGSHCFAISQDHHVYAWGGNSFGQLGVGNTYDHFQAAEVHGLLTQKVRYVSCGEDHTAVLTQGGKLLTFGSGSSGQLGHGNLKHEHRPKQVVDLMGSEVTQVACGRRHTLVLIGATGKLYAFGLGGSGQLGTGKKAMETSPCQVAGNWQPFSKQAANGVSMADASAGHVICSISAGGDQSFAVVDTGSAPIDMRFLTDVSNMVIPRNFAANRPLIASASMINDLLAPENASETNSDYLGVLLEHVIGTPACNSMSFKNPPGSPVLYDMVGLKQMFDTIEATDIGLHHVIVPCSLVTFMARRLENLHPRTDEACQFFLFVLAMPRFRKPLTWDNSITTLCLLSDCFAKVAAPHRDAMARWYSHDLESFGYAVEVVLFNVKAFLKQVQEKKRRMLDIRPLMNLLDFLFQVNDSWCKLYPVEHFYVPEIQEYTDLQREYNDWQRRRSRDVLFCCYPFLLDLPAKSLLVRFENEQYSKAEELKARLNTMLTHQVELPYLLITVRRQYIVNDSLRQLTRANILGQLKTGDLRKPLKVEFANEEGIDDGGVKKEFFMILFRDLLSPDYGMFQVNTDSQTVYFSPWAEMEDDLANFNLIGMLCGLAIYNNVIIDVSFPTVLYHKLMQRFKASKEHQEGVQFGADAMRRVPISRQSQESSFLDSEEFKLFTDIEPVVARTFQNLLSSSDDVSSYGLCFDISRRCFDVDQVIELRPGGSSTPVTNDNREEFVRLYVDYTLHKSVAKQFDSFADGFFAVCENRVFDFLHPSELQALVIGSRVNDFKVLQKVAKYQSIFSDKHPVILMFWEVFFEFDAATQQKFFQFLTGTDRVPVGGIESMQVIIQPSNAGDDYLPVAHTCFNVLDLPLYSSKPKLQTKLTQAIDLAEGFHLI